MIPEATRRGRFWLVGLFLIMVNVGVFVFEHVILKHGYDLVQVGFHLIVLVVALSLLDRELADHWWQKFIAAIKAWRGQA